MKYKYYFKPWSSLNIGRNQSLRRGKIVPLSTISASYTHSAYSHPLFVRFYQIHQILLPASQIRVSVWARKSQCHFRRFLNQMHIFRNPIIPSQMCHFFIMIKFLQFLSSVPEDITQHISTNKTSIRYTRTAISLRNSLILYFPYKIH